MLESTLNVFDLHCLETQTSHLHCLKLLEVKQKTLVVAASLYTVNLFAILQDRLFPLEVNLAPAENVLNSMAYDSYSNTLVLVDTRRSLKVLTIC